MKKPISQYEQQAIDFAEKFNVSMTYHYTGHRARLDKYITANWMITLSRPGKKPYSFEFSTSVNDSWEHIKEGTQFTFAPGLPHKIDIEKFFASPQAHKERFDYRGGTVRRKKIPPTIYDVLACVEKTEIGAFDDFCAEFGYSNDNIKAKETWEAVLKESWEIRRLFADCLEELSEIK